ncbi:hypothetical protein U8C35_06405 [Sinorhizobium medicae]|uniref:hypothetical protein n=1 Tax=Sinorhizobium medicae TaxID=110321 RepID=UPI002AF6CA00|nr:hypothetical protein [Sinorhizobium medicae]WQO60064.1 hypothetical protein U8C35_06405 [Sinorhizobium medicae]
MTEKRDIRIVGLTRPPAFEAAMPPTSVWTKLGNHPLLLAAVASLTSIVCVVLPIYLAQPDTSDYRKRISELEIELQQAKDELSAARDKIAVSPPELVNVEAIVIPHGQPVGILDKKYIATVTAIRSMTAEIRLKKVGDNTDFTDTVFMTVGSRINLKYDDYVCLFAVTDVDANRAVVHTECRRQAVEPKG